MIITKILFAAATAVVFFASPGMAQSAFATGRAGHHYQGGPKTEVPHHMGKKADADPYQAWAYGPGIETRLVAPTSTAHQYRGGPRSIH